MAKSRVEVKKKDTGWKEFFRRASEIKNGRVRVGILSDSEKGGMHVEGSDLTVAEIAAVNEFGTEDGHIPERSFLRSTFDEQREQMVEDGKKLMGQVLDGKMPVARALGLLGLKLATAVKKKIAGVVPPPNAASTIAHKGSDHPLIDTGRMLNAITWAIDSGDGESGKE